ncbi:ribosome recycling factor [candidate division NPL-UPA2 bacterium Unc8]|uniref:Ribosome-recycling factor n=1 Tax=candidate division NPL-UPA2 bacterium Unc8 TaxID=1980939 RepID=A0A399FXF8_UNCN2|nr:Ribosome-recycling factor [Bacillota bacterium]MBT9137786.1 Ribosome-recycling factor [Bacillota bacterium]MBT9146406.1 Ribosome-recycling factor [Bacillota bacterium]RII00090.1 MAG: ribosome recycling factor [candidate division NPL-UPA2 bacterium Unc8]
MEKPIKEVLAETEEKMCKSVAVTREELTAMHAGRASPGLLHGIKVNYYGQLVPLAQTANITISDPSLIIIQPWDKSTIPEIEKAILKADIGLVPNNDGKIIRVPVSPLSEERRKELVKMAKRIAEEGIIALRGVRHKEREMLKDMEKESQISSDESHWGQKRIEELAHKYTEEMDKILESKVKEIMIV